MTQLDEALGGHPRSPVGAVRPVMRVRRNNAKIAHGAACHMLPADGTAKGSGARPQKRKWVRFERKYSNAMWHVGWHVMKYGPLAGSHLVAYLDDASRCVTGFGVFSEATEGNTVLVLHHAIGRFGAPAQVLSDHGKQFTASRRGTPRRGQAPTLFERELRDAGISHVMSRAGHSRTSGKARRFFQTLEEEIDHFGGIAEFIGYYNEERLHFALDMETGETPLLAFRRRRADERVRAENPGWVEEDSNE